MFDAALDRLHGKIGLAESPLKWNLSGHIFLRLAVHDLLSKRIGSTEIPLNVVAPQQAAVSRLPSR